MKAFKIFLASIILILVGIVPIFAALNYDPFQLYGKTLPWAKDGQGGNNFMVLTVPPNLHKSRYGYFAQDFAKNGGDMATIGIPVHAISDGIVEVVNNETWNKGLGRYIILDHGNGFKSRYSHMQLLVLNQSDIGKTIRKGQEIGTIGATGNVTGANLELTILKNGTKVKATTDGIPFDGSYSMLQPPYARWVSPVDNFDKNQFSIFRSETEVRPDDPDNPWDPAVIDPLDRYLENYGYMFPQGMIAEPVAAPSGNFVHRNLDVSLKSEEGLPLSFERFYNALDSYEGPNGKGWSHAYNMQILAHEDFQYSVKFPDGRGETFKETDTDLNSYTSTFTEVTPFSVGKLERLGEVDNYKFKYTEPNGMVYIFNSDRDMSASPSEPGAYWGMVERIEEANGNFLQFSYDAKGNLVNVTDNFDRSLQLNYNGSDLLTKVEDSSGKYASYAYNFDGKLATVIKTNGESWTYTYDSTGYITTITDAEQKRFVDNTYDADGRVTKQFDANGGVALIAYEKQGNNTVTTFTDNNGNKTVLVHNKLNYLIAETDPLGATATYEYDANGRVVREQDKNGSVKLFERDAVGNVTKEVLADGSTRSFSYNTMSLPTKITTASGDVNVEYSSAGKITQVTNQAGKTISYTYDSRNLLQQKIDEAGNKIAYTYNNEGLLTSEKDVDTDSALVYEYDFAGNQTAVIDALGRTTRMEYNSFGKVTKITDAKGFVVSFEYDKNGNLEKELDEAGYAKEYVSDGNENIIEIKYPNGSSEKFAYDKNNNKTQSIDRNGNVTVYSYDSANQNTKVEYYDTAQNLLSSTTFEYDIAGNILKKAVGNSNITTYSYDSLNRPVQITDALGYKMYLEYNNLGQLVQEKNFEGNAITYEYDALGRKIKIINPIGGETNLEYDSKGNVIKSRDAIGNSTFREFDSTNKLVRMTNTKGAIANYAYDKVGRLISQTNFAGEKSIFEYDQNDNLIFQTDSLGNRQSFEYDSRNKLAVIIDPNGNATRIEYNAMKNKAREIDVYGNIREYFYDNNDNLLKFTGENRVSNAYEYDGLNRTVKEIDGRGSVSEITYDAHGNLNTVRDKNGNVTRLTYDAIGQRKSLTDVLGYSEEYEYSANGATTQVKNKAGNVAQFEYDAAGRKVKDITPNGNSSTYQYDLMGRITSQSDYKGIDTNFEYDSEGNLTKLTDRSGAVTSYVYDIGNRITSKTNPDGGVTKYGYDANGRLITETDSEGGVTTYAYDNASNLVEVTDAKGNTTQISYDKLNRNASVTNALGKTSSKLFDLNGRVITETDANGNETSYQYDPANNIVSTVTANGAQTAFEYDANGNMIKMTNPRGFVTTLSYDQLNRQVSQTLPDGSVVSTQYDEMNRAVKATNPRGLDNFYTYDAIGNLIKEVDQLGFATTYSYDKNNNLAKVTDRAANFHTFTYDTRDQLIESVDPFGNKKSLEYDVMGRLTKGTNERGAISQIEYDTLGRSTKNIDALGGINTFVYDSNGNILSQTDALGRETQLEYDALNRINSRINALNGARTYTYDNVGNVIGFSDENGNTTNIVYDAVYNKVAETNALGNTSGYAFDQNRNLVSVRNANGYTSTFNYDERDRKISEVLPGGETFNFTYDGNGNQLTKKMPKGGVYAITYDGRDQVTKVVDPLGNTKQFSYDALLRVEKQTNATNDTTNFKYDALSRLTSVTDALTKQTNFEYDSLGNLVKELYPNTALVTYEYDLLNRRVNEINQLGNEWKFQYDSVGNILAASEPNGSVAQYTYDALNRKISQDYGGPTIPTQYTYDNVGNVTSIRYGSNINNYEYDEIYQTITADNIIENTSYKTAYTFDPVGNRTSITYPDGKIGEYAYNVNNLLDSLTINYNGDQFAAEKPQALVTRFRYDQNLNLVKQTNPNLTEVVQSYDSADRLIEVKNRVSEITESSGVTTPLQEFATYSYELNPNGDKLKETILNVVNNFDRCENVQNNGSDGHNPEDCLLPDGAQPQSDDIDVLAVVRNYEYDALQRLTRVGNSESTGNTFDINYLALPTTAVEEYIYDSIGNRTAYYKTAYEQGSAEGKKVMTQYIYNQANQLVADTGFDYSYDSNGNRLSQVSKDNTEKHAYGYDVKNQLARVKTKTPDGIIYQGNSDNVKAQIEFDFIYNYDGLGRRVSKVNNTNYSICKGQGEKGGDLAKHDCNNGTGNDSQQKDNRTDYFSTSIPYYGINQIDYVYDSQSYETVSEYFDRIDPVTNVGNGQIKPNDKAKPAPGKPVEVSEFFDVHTNFYKAYGLDKYQPTTLIASENIAERPLPELSLCKGNGEKNKDGNPLDCNNGSGNDNKISAASLLEELDVTTEIDPMFGIARNNGSNGGSNGNGGGSSNGGSSGGTSTGPSGNTNNGNHSTNNGQHNGEDNSNGLGHDRNPDVINDGTETNNPSNGNSTEAPGQNKPGENSVVVNRFNRNQVVNYYHHNGIGSVVAVSNYNIGYDLTGVTALTDAKLKVATPPVFNSRIYEAFGKVSTHAYDPKGEGRKPWEMAAYPYAYGFMNWDSKTYSDKEIDIETGNYYYGSRFYNATNGTWNKQDTYRGELSDPQSLNRYAFVSNNPVNKIDVYGFSESKGVVDGMMNQYRSDNDTVTATTISDKGLHQGEATRLTGLLPGLQSKMNTAWWSMYNAKVDHYDDVVMNGILGRLMARGYEMNYESVVNHMSNRIAKSGQVYAVRTSQYQVAEGNYYGTITQRDGHLDMVVRLDNYVTYLKEERTGFESWAGGFNKAYDNSYWAGKDSWEKGKEDYSADFDTFIQQNDLKGLGEGFGKYLSRYVENPEEAGKLFGSVFSDNFQLGQGDAYKEWDASRSWFDKAWDGVRTFVEENIGTIVTFTVGAVAVGLCIAGSAGLATPVCLVAGAVLLNEGLNLLESGYSQATGKELDIQSSLMQAVGVDKNAADMLSGGMDALADIGAMTVGTIMTGGLLSAAMPTTWATGITTFTALPKVQTALNVLQIGGGVVTTGLGIQQAEQTYSQYQYCQSSGTCTSANYRNIGGVFVNSATAIGGGVFMTASGTSGLSNQIKSNNLAGSADDYMAPCPLNCFVAGTKIQTDQGVMNVEDIKLGDKVLAYNPETGEQEYKEVVYLHTRVTKETLKISIPNETIETTREHPFWVVGKGWTEAGDIELGDKLLDVDGKEIEVLNLEYVHAETTVYNFEVKDFHTYYVGISRVLSHNCSNPQAIKPTDSHHSDPKYLGGNPKQPLIEIDRNLHQQVHRDIDIIYPRTYGKKVYDSLRATNSSFDEEVFFNLGEIYQKYELQVPGITDEFINNFFSRYNGI